MNATSQRQHAQALFAQTGLPSKRDEHWKYTDVSHLAELAQTPSPALKIEATTSSLGIAKLDAYVLVFNNGIFESGSSSLPNGVEIGTIASLLAQENDEKVADEKVAQLFALSGNEPLFNGFLALNAAHAIEGSAICIKTNTKLDKPLYIKHISNQNITLRHSICFEAFAEAEIIEHYLGAEEGDAALSNVVTNIMLNAGAQCRHYRLQQEGSKQAHIGRVQVKQCQGSNYRLHAVELGGALSRADIVVDLAEQGASCSLHGLYVLAGRQHVDHHTRIDHTAPHCTSDENYRTVLDGRAHGVFNGKVVVHKDAIKTDSAQSNGNLLLSQHAQIDTKPELEIYNDDVKCAHGATVGQLDDTQLFYLRSRGISEASAQELLTFAFADEVLASMSSDVVRRYVEKAAFAKLPHGEELEELLA